MQTIEDIKQWLLGLLELLEVEKVGLEIADNEDRKEIQLDLEQHNSGEMIGYRGETLLGLEKLLRLMTGEKVMLNINDYRQEREQKMRETAVAMARRAYQEGRAFKLHGLSSRERFIVHDEIINNEELRDYDLESISEGEGRDRVLIIRQRPY
jgi:spoIIIJ-associated protein